MRGRWRLLAVAAALLTLIGVERATAQTVTVTQAPPGATVEVVFNASPVGSAVADATGIASVTFPTAGAERVTDVSLYVDVCENLRRVILVERGVDLPPPQVGCVRKALVGQYLMQRVTTFVVDVTQAAPSARLRQGPAPAAWLTPPTEAGEVGPVRVASPLPTGFVVFGGMGLASFRDAVILSCGSVADCSGGGTKFAYSAGAAFWFTPFLGAEFAYLHPLNVKVTGDGGNFRFTSDLDTHLVSMVGKVGVPLARTRLYGQGGLTYHWATSTTAQSIDSSTVTIDGVSTTVEGGASVFQFRTSGWGWTIGGGLEGWIKSSLAIYGEAGWSTLEGKDRDEGEAFMDDRVLYLVAGVRLRLGS